MEQTVARLTVFFDPPFWVGLYERDQEGRYTACKIVFGAEPKDHEVYDFMLRMHGSLKFTPAVGAESRRGEPGNPKRMQREIRRRMEREPAAGTKAQQALALLREQSKQERKIHSRAQREEEAAFRFEQRREKRREKHKGH